MHNINEILRTLDDSQRTAATHPNGPLMVIAGPGSGKTRVLTSRVAHLLANGTPAHRILAVTFTNKAAGEMRDRLNSMVGVDTSRRLWVATFHSFAAKFLRIEHEAAGLPKGFSILDTGDSERIIRRAAKELGAASDDNLKDYVRAARNHISSCKNRGVGFNDPNSRTQLPRIADVAARYMNANRQAGAVDFDDLLLHTRNLLTGNPDVRERWTAKFDHVLVDEFQDTNPVQMDIVRTLVSTTRALTVVGDLDQSIYAFRAADPEQMAGFTDEFPDAHTVALTGNYRSTPQIVETCQAIIEQNPGRHRAVQSAAQPAGEPVTLRMCADDRDEATHIANLISSNGGPLSNFAVLVRTNAQTRPLEEAFTKAGINYSLIGTVKFFDRAEIKDALAWLRAAVNPREPVAFERAATTPRRGIGPAVLDAVTQQAASTGATLLDAADMVAGNGGRGATQLLQFTELLRNIRTELATNGVTAGLDLTLRSGLRDHWAKAADRDARLENLDELARAATEFAVDGIDEEGRPVADLTPPEQVVAFLNHVALLSGTESEAADTVRVMTVHASKGREFHTVFVVGLEEGLFPHSRAETTDDIREERRLFFVAASRAQQRLLLSLALERFLYGRRVETRPSRFLASLPASIRKETSRRAATPASYGNAPRQTTRTGTTRATSGGWESDARKNARARRQARRQANNGPRLSEQDATPGTRVHHPQFGSGQITAVRGDTLTIQFADGVRMLGRHIAPLRKDD